MHVLARGGVLAHRLGLAGRGDGAALLEQLPLQRRLRRALHGGQLGQRGQVAGLVDGDREDRRLLDLLRLHELRIVEVHVVEADRVGRLRLARVGPAEVERQLGGRILVLFHREHADERLRAGGQIDGVAPVLLVGRPRHPDLRLHLDRLGGVGRPLDRIDVALLDDHLAVAHLRVPRVIALVGDGDAELTVLHVAVAGAGRRERRRPRDVLAALRSRCCRAARCRRASGRRRRASRWSAARSSRPPR